MKLYFLSKAPLPRLVAQPDKSKDLDLLMTVTPLGPCDLRVEKEMYSSLLSCKPSSDSNQENPGLPLLDEWLRSSQHKRTLVLLGGNDRRRSHQPPSLVLTFSNHPPLRQVVRHPRLLQSSLPRDLRRLLCLQGQRRLHEISLQHRQKLLHLHIVTDKKEPIPTKEATMLLRTSLSQPHSLCCLTNIQSTLQSSAIVR